MHFWHYNITAYIVVQNQMIEIETTIQKGSKTILQLPVFDQQDIIQKS